MDNYILYYFCVVRILAVVRKACLWIIVSLTIFFFLNEERLWTPYDNLAKDPRQVTGRLAHFRCLLNQRGVAAAPLGGPGRVAPEEPGSCYTQ